jgi:hypothetical protein
VVDFTAWDLVIHGTGQAPHTLLRAAHCKRPISFLLSYKDLLILHFSGCGRCSVEGGTVQLLYWPPTTATAGANVTLTSEKPFVVETLGTTLTSPTLYVSYHSLYATNGCGHQVGTPMYDQIIAIPTASTLSSVWAYPLGGAVIFYNGPGVITSTASLNITDLHEPVPMSIYSSQPFCASYAQANAEHFEVNSWDCPRDSPYKPVIKLPHDLLQGLDPAWAECAEAYGGVYDPPIALRPADAIAVPTRPAGNGEPTPTPAAEASKPRPTTAKPTRAASQVTEHVGSAKTSASAGDHGSGSFTPTMVSEEFTEGPDRTPASVGDHNTGDSTSEEHQSGQAVTSINSHDQGGSFPQNGQHENGDQPGNNNLAPTRDTKPSIGGASPTGSNPDNEVDSKPAPNRPAGNNAMSIIESALHVAISQIRPQKPSQPQASEGVFFAPKQETPGSAGHNDAAHHLNTAGVLQIGSNVFSQLQAESGAAVFADPHSTVTLSPGGPVVNIGSHAVSAAASNIFVVGSGSIQVTTSLPPSGVSAIEGQSPAVVAAGAESAHINAEISNPFDQGPLTIGDQIFTAGIADGAVVYANAEITVTFKPGHFPTSVAGVDLSEAESGRVIVGTGGGATTSALPTLPEALDTDSNILNQEALTIGDQVLTAAISDGALVYANVITTVTLKPGHFPASAGGVQLSEAAPGRLVIGTGSNARTLVLPTKAEALTIGTRVFTPVKAQTGVHANAETTISLGPDGSATTIDGIRVSQVAGGLVVVGTGSDATTVALPTNDAALTIGTEVLTPVATQTGAVFANEAATVSIGPVGSVTTIDGTRVSVAAAGVIVVGTGSDVTTLTLPTHDKVLTIGTEVLTPIAVQTVTVFADGDTTISIGPMGSVTTIDGIRVSVAAPGVMVIGTGSDATIVTLAAGDFAPASRTISKDTHFSSSTDGGLTQSTGDPAFNTGTSDEDAAESAGNMQTFPRWETASFAALLVLSYA